MQELTVQTSKGRIRGSRVTNGVTAFLGIPYGAATSDSARFRPPSAAPSWEGIYDATRFGPSCPQGNPTLPEDDPASTRGLDLPVGENCLVLNVWTPKIDPSNRAVMVWIHGGGFRMGSGSHPVTNGANLAAHGDVVVVSLNHRLGVFGHLYLEDVCGPDFAGSGVAGLLDIVLALQWVRDNIASFGGDPWNVTVFGESGGGRKICTLLAMPDAAGLFHRAIVQSGAHPRAISREVASHFAKRFLEFLGGAPGDAKLLTSLSADELYENAEHFIDQTSDPLIPKGAPGRWLLSPVVDGKYLPADPGELGCHVSASVPLLIGTNKDEAALTLARAVGAGNLSKAELIDRLSPMLGIQTKRIIDAHREERPHETAWETFVSISSEDRRLLSIEIAEKKAQRNAAPVYMYFFTWESNSGLLKAAHTMEIPFVFRNLEATSIVGTRADRFTLSDTISDAWLAFAKVGTPTSSHLPSWPPFDQVNRSTMIFDAPSRVENDPWKKPRLAWEGMLVPMPWDNTSLVTGAIYLNMQPAIRGQ